jgi:hypothetical protein
MSDLLDNEPRPTPRWVLPAVVVGVVAVLIALAVRAPSPAHPRQAGTTPSASPSPGPVGATAVATTRTAGNSCGGDVEQPLVAPGPRPTGTHLRLLIGDRDLRVVDVDDGSVHVLSVRPDRRSVTQLAGHGRDVIAVLRNTCDPYSYGHGEVGVVDLSSGSIGATMSGDEILPGLPTTLRQYGADGSEHVRELGSRTTTTLRAGWSALARTPTSYFAAINTPLSDQSTPPTLGLGDVGTGKLTKKFGAGSVVAASADRLFWLAGTCPGPHCLLTMTRLDGTNTAQRIGGGGAWGGVVSPDGTKLAFRKVRTTGQLGSHPAPPNDIAVLDTTTGRLRVLPGLVLPPKSGTTLVWSPDSTWLAIGADLGTGALVLIWREGMERPARVPIPPTGGGTTGPPALLVLPAQSR